MTKTTDRFGARHNTCGCGAPTAFPWKGKPRSAADSEGSSGVQGLSPGTPFLPPAKKPSVFGFFCNFVCRLGGAR